MTRPSHPGDGGSPFQAFRPVVGRARRLLLPPAMGRNPGVSSVALLLLAFLAGGCGPAEGPSDPRLLPLEPGARWEYRVSDRAGRPGARTVRVVGTEGDEFVLETRQDASRILSWVRPGEMILTIREETAGVLREFEPGALRAVGSAHVQQGQVVAHSWQEGPETFEASWAVIGRETLDVDAGRFETIRFLRRQTGQPDTTLWYAPGVGLVRAWNEDERLDLLQWVVP